MSHEKAKRRTGRSPSGRTPAERAAINARADAWIRPLSAAQRSALKLLAKGPMHRDRQGFHPIRNMTDERVPIAVMRTLAKRGFAVLADFENGATVTAAGRREAARRR